MQIIKTQTDKLVVGSNDVSQPEGEKDQTPTGTAILNGPVVIGDGAGHVQNRYQGVLNVSSGSATQLPLDLQPKLNVDLAAAIDGNVRVIGDAKNSKRYVPRWWRRPRCSFRCWRCDFYWCS